MEFLGCLNSLEIFVAYTEKGPFLQLPSLNHPLPPPIIFSWVTEAQEDRGTSYKQGSFN